MIPLFSNSPSKIVSTKLKVCFLNIGGKFEAANCKNFLEENNVDIFLTTETWKKYFCENIKGFVHDFLPAQDPVGDSRGRKKEGIAAFWREDLHLVVKRVTNTDTSDKILWLEISNKTFRTFNSERKS